jgi:hypothetical protein
MEGESAENDRRGPVYPGIALDYFSQVVCPGGSAHHLVEHGERSIGQLGFHLSDEDQQSSKPPLIIEAVEVLGTED